MVVRVGARGRSRGPGHSLCRHSVSFGGVGVGVGQQDGVTVAVGIEVFQLVGVCGV